MKLAGKIVIALVVAAVAVALRHFLPAVPEAAMLVVACLATAVLVSLPAGAAVTAAEDTSHGEQQQAAPARKPADGPREGGQVKWFNVSKGFGFVTKDNGDEIFVHFRSIRGEGRRALREGQRVTFVETVTEKGPQAEDVEAL